MRNAVLANRRHERQTPANSGYCKSTIFTPRRHPHLRVDVSLIAATTPNCRRWSPGPVSRGDMYYRLNVVSVRRRRCVTKTHHPRPALHPPLQQRVRSARRLDNDAKSCCPLQWPGNIASSRMRFDGRHAREPHDLVQYLARDFAPSGSKDSPRRQDATTGIARRHRRQAIRSLRCRTGAEMRRSVAEQPARMNKDQDACDRHAARRVFHSLKLGARTLISDGVQSRRD